MRHGKTTYFLAIALVLLFAQGAGAMVLCVAPGQHASLDVPGTTCCSSALLGLPGHAGNGDRAFEQASCCYCIDSLVQIGAAVSSRPSEPAPAASESLCLPAICIVPQSEAVIKTSASAPVPDMFTSQLLRSVIILA